MKTRHVYCQYSEQQVRESGLLSAQRMEQVSLEITQRIEPCFDREGREIPKAFVANLAAGQRLLFARVEDGNAEEYMRRSVMAAVLTIEELEQINRSCLESRSAALEADRFEKARKVASWEGGVFYGDRYFPSMEELYDSLDREESPEWVWPAAPTRVLPSLSVGEVVENDLSDNGWEDMDTADLNGVAELQVALDKFVAANAGVVSYHPDYSTAVLLPARREVESTSCQARR